MSTEAAEVSAVEEGAVVASVSADSASAPTPMRYTLLRVKRKRDESPVDALILSGATEQSQLHKRTLLEDLRLNLERVTLTHSTEPPPGPAEAARVDVTASEGGVVRKVFKLVGTTFSTSDGLNDALLARIEALQEQRRAKAVHPSILPAPSASTERRVEQAQRRASSAREQRVMQARSHPPSTSSTPLPLASEPFTFLDVHISRPPSLSTASIPAPPPPSSVIRLHRKQAAVQSQLRTPSLEQERKDELFSRAMSIVKALPDREKMEAYASLLDDYWEVTDGAQGGGGGGGEGRKSFVQQVQERGEKDTSGLPLRRIRPTQATQPIDVMADITPRPSIPSASTDWVYDVYHVVDEEESITPASIDVEAARVVIDSRVAGWFGLVADEEEGAVESEEDEEDENREGWEGNDYPEEEEDEDGDGIDPIERMEGGPSGDVDEAEELHRLRQELRRSGNDLIAQSDDEDDEWVEEGDEEDDDDEDDYEVAHRSYRPQYDSHI